MKKLSLPEFKDYCLEHSFQTFIFATANQSWNETNAIISVELKFNSIVTTFNPNTIYLRERHNTLKISQISYVYVHKPCMLGDVFTIVCDNSHMPECSSKYKLICR